MSVKFEAQMTQKSMYDFLLHHTYSHVMGIIAIVFGLVNVTIGIHELVINNGNGTTFLVFGLLFIFGMPVMLWFSAGTNIKKVAMFAKPVCYELNEEGVLVSQDDKSQLSPWSTIVRVTATRQGIFLYQGKNRAVVLQRDQLGEQETAAIEIISTHVNPSKVKIRR